MFENFDKIYTGDNLKEKKAETLAIFEEQKKTLGNCLLKNDLSIRQDITVNKKMVTEQPIHPIVLGILKAYSSATELYSELNRALREGVVESYD